MIFALYIKKSQGSSKYYVSTLTDGERLKILRKRKIICFEGGIFGGVLRLFQSKEGGGFQEFHLGLRRGLKFSKLCFRNVWTSQESCKKCGQNFSFRSSYFILFIVV